MLKTKKKGFEIALKADFGRDDKIRTCDFHVPNVALYQTEPHLVLFRTLLLYHYLFYLSSGNFKKSLKCLKFAPPKISGRNILLYKVLDSCKRFLAYNVLDLAGIVRRDILGYTDGNEPLCNEHMALHHLLGNLATL